ncbi:hypothetical protein FPSE5266_12253 [Fusarium pseudograminearum]|nr:hypothetical protein FPSE5266_12253 [Fusarium pseudograminearum]
MVIHSEQCPPQGPSIPECEVITTPLTLDQMPNEMVLKILSTMPNINSLHAFAASCKAVYNVYEYNKVQILAKVFLDKIDKGVYEEAAITERLKREKWKDAKDGCDSILRVYNSKRTIRSEDLTLENIKDMWRLHKSVEYFADRLPTTLLREHPVTNVKGHFSLTPRVRARFQRALYRLSSHLIIIEKVDAVFNAGQDSRDLPQHDVRHKLPTRDQGHVLWDFHTYYSAFEVEQLSCLCSLLTAEIAPYFNDFLEHDIELGSRLNNYIDNLVHPGGMRLISLGLSFLHSLLTAATQDDLHEVVRPVADQITWVRGEQHVALPKLDMRNFGDLLEIGKLSASSGLTFWESVDLWGNGKPLDCLIRTPFFDDHDSGPASAWSAMSSFSIHMRSHGEADGHFNSPTDPWAYVFWDLKMLENSGFGNLNGDGGVENNVVIPQGHPIFNTWQPLQKYTTPYARKNIILSAREKCKMLERGQAGYFDFETFCENNNDKCLVY